MIKVGIAVGRYKLPTFRRHLSLAGFKFDESPGLTADTALLTVHALSLVTLKPVVEKAHAACRHLKSTTRSNKP